MRKVAIVGQAQVNASDIGKSRERMLFDLCKGFYDRIGMTRHDIDTFVLCSNDFSSGHTISNVFEDCPVGAYMKDETKVEADGVMAVTYALARIMSGLYDVALVVGNSQGGSVMRPFLVMDYTMSPTYDRQLGLLNELSSAALQARAYLDTYGVADDVLDKIAARNLRNAAGNPDAFNGSADATPESVAGSEELYEPIKQDHCYPFSDGACLLLLASEEKANKFSDKPIWIRGVGDSLDTYYPERSFARSKSVRLAGQRAYKMAGIGDPAGDLDLVEVSAKFASQEPIICEGLGLFSEGSASDVADRGLAEIDGAMPVSPSGGAFGAYALSSGGLVRVAECYKQLTGSAGDLQVADARTALAHGQDGLYLQHNAVMVLSTEEG